MTSPTPFRRSSLLCAPEAWAFSCVEGASLAVLGFAAVAALTAFGHVHEEYLDHYALLFVALAAGGLWPFRTPSSLAVRALAGAAAIAYFLGTSPGERGFSALLREAETGYSALLRGPEVALALWRADAFPALRTFAFDVAIVGMYLLALRPLRRLGVFWVFLAFVLVGVGEAYLGFSGEAFGLSEPRFALSLVGAAVLYLLSSAEGLRLLVPRRAFLAFFTFLLLGASVLGTAAALPKPPPAWDDPWPALTQRFARAGRASAPGTLAAVHPLGGPFVAYGEVHATASLPAGAPVPTRWRTAAYDVYTGRDWEVAPDPPAAPLLAAPAGPGVDVEIVARLRDVPVPGVLERPYASFEGAEHLLYLLGRGSWQGVPVGVPYAIRAFLYTPEFEEAPLTRASPRSSTIPPSTSLELPQDLPSSVRELAARLRREALGADRPPKNAQEAWRVARRVQTYLRDEGNFTYETWDVPFLRPGEDYVAEFLFTTRRGYCEHFASSAVVLLRAAGVPARFAVGYGPGEVTADTQGVRVVLRDRDAHAWAEVYLEGLGFVPLEVTPGMQRPEALPASTEEFLPHPSTSAPAPPPENGKDLQGSGASEGGNLSSPAPAQPAAFAVPGLLALLLGLTAGVVFGRRRRKMRLSPLDREALRRRYIRALWIAGMCGGRRERGETVGAYAARLPQGAVEESFRRLTQAYLAAYYGPPSPGDSDFLAREREFAASVRRHLLRCLWQGIRRAVPSRPRSLSSEGP
ncbi:MAG: ransglutaminase-like enzyme, putative cysteine protease [Brockia lithotrophica]|uniref:Ransglutaminase-like enzyme, putative cysteine protease n=1 Tax=Brockia lithotrophica TaxID=933949 RepID=A0A2T5GAR6_9BACL|nr:MAG: ransglutaminase-like enzyme, putative cysteine protease [Brockia lithotrophica]